MTGMLTGVFAPLPTPFDEQDRVDVARLRATVPHWVDTRLAGFVVLGTNGEAGLMDDAECDRVIAETRALVPRTRPLIAGTGRESTHAAVQAARRAADLGVDAVLVRTPSFFKSQMTGDAFIRHYTAVADASPVPVVLYNMTAVTGVNILPATVARLAGHPNIIGMKESNSDIAQIADLAALISPDFRIMAGSGSTFYAALCAGLSGGILGLATLLPDACVQIFELTAARRFDEARALQRQVLPVARLISTGFGVPGLKAALRIIGCDVGDPRPPLMPVSESTLAALREALARFEEVRA